LKINNNPPVTPLHPADQGKSSPVKDNGAVKSAGAQTSGSVTHLSQRLNDATHDVDTAKIDQIRQAIADGTLEINPEKIADSLIESLKDIKPHDPENTV
jgi:negative regulator of flagellin synthesis FlgM